MATVISRDDDLVDFSEYDNTEDETTLGGGAKNKKKVDNKTKMSKHNGNQTDNDDTDDDITDDDDNEENEDDDSDKELNDVAGDNDDDDEENKNEDEITSSDANITINKNIKKNGKKQSKCVYDYLPDDDQKIDLIFDDDIETDARIVNKSERITKPILQNFERVRITGERVQQLTLGAKPMIKNVDGVSPLEIAKLELKEKIMPIIIERELPCGRKERWYLNELEQ